ncbi:MAG: hypothetical protein HY689_08610 [Chloroflexi bacterium]|nr:hypothetical protein [Chloroflexota bacterium]
MSFATAVTAVVQSIAVPYGYTLAIWSAGALAVAKYGVPRKRHVLLFVAGAMLGYLIFDIPVWSSLEATSTISVHLPSIALLNLFPLVTSITSALLTKEIENKTIGFMVTGFTATTVYILSLSLLLIGLAHQ